MRSPHALGFFPVKYPKRRRYFSLKMPVDRVGKICDFIERNGARSTSDEFNVEETLHCIQEVPGLNPMRDRLTCISRNLWGRGALPDTWVTVAQPRLSL